MAPRWVGLSLAGPSLVLSKAVGVRFTQALRIGDRCFYKAAWWL